MRRSYKNKTKKRNGGGATALPLSYFSRDAVEPAANSGHDLLKAIPPLEVRPRIGGKSDRTKKYRKIKGGFVPSIMEGFVAAASKYIVPIALFAGYKLMSRKKSKSNRRYTRKR
jgi:hypothetical protein